ncbi:MAG: CPBP family intramembrane metalloprotease [Betaproteobacteria bacterium]|nr:CPBP family intramembrane metalloprotease [Betaproteobacteria bacterium]
MTTLPDVLFVALAAVAGPLLGYSVYWPAFRRLSEADPAWARRWLWASNTAEQWMLVGFGAAIWMAAGRSWTSLGFVVPDGWRLWAAIALCLLVAGYFAYAVAVVARSADARASVRQQFSGELAAVLPASRTDMYWFSLVSLTAGFCEEFLWRGYLIWVLAPWLGWWGAAALSLLMFALCHAYQGWRGILRTGIVGAIFTLLVAAFDSLWPAIVLHALVDLANGLMAWLVLRERLADGKAVEGSRTAVSPGLGHRSGPGRDESGVASDRHT